MELRTCKYCGTEYSIENAKCPLCGAGSTEEVLVETHADTKNAVHKNNKQKGKGPWGVLCIVFGILVMAGIVLFFLHMDFFREGGFDFNEIPTKLVEYNQTSSEPALEEPAQQPEQTPVMKEEPEVQVDPDSKACTGLTISQDTVILDEEGGKIFLTAVARPSDCEDPIVYASSDENVVTVTESGMITAISPGQAEIIVTCGTITKVCTIDCAFQVAPPVEEEPEQVEEEPIPEEDEPADPDAPTLSSTDFTLFSAGEECVLSVKNAPDGVAISYATSNTAVVSVDNSGKVVAKGEGTATITVTVGDVSLTCIARCNFEDAAEDGSDGSYEGPFTISHSDVTLSKKGETFVLTLTDANGKKVSGLVWTASNGAATVSGNTVKAAIAGQTLVSCEYDGKTYSCIVRCNF